MKDLFLLPVMLCFIAFGNLQAQSATLEFEMQEFSRKFMTAYNQQDVDALKQMYLEDAVRINQNGNELSGPDKIADYFAKQFRLNNATAFVRQISVGWSDYEHAWITNGTFELHGKTIVYDQPVHVSEQYANVMIQKDGAWKIARSIHTPLEHADPTVAANIRMYTDTWNAIINERRLELFNEDHFTEDVVMHAEPENLVGIEAMAGYYKNLISAFSDIKFTIKNIFGEGDQLVKHWAFEGKHTGNFFGIPASGNPVSITGSTIVRMSSDGRIAAEQDFMDNIALLSQMGVVSSPGNVAVVDGLYQAFSKGDIPAALATMDPDIVWNEAENFPYADNNPYIGPKAVLEGVFARIGAEWEYWKLNDIQLHDMSNNQVLATLRYGAKHKQTGKVIDSQTAHLFTLKNGKIVAFQQFTDTRQAAEAVRK